MSIGLLPRCIPDVLNVRDPRSSGWPVWFLVPVSDVKTMGGQDGCQLPQITSKPVNDMCRWGQSQKLGIPHDPDDPLRKLEFAGSRH